MTAHPAPSAPGRHGLLRRLAGHARLAIPPAGLSLVGATLWSGVMATSAAHGLWLRSWETPAKILHVAALFGMGGAAGFPLGLFLARFLSMGKGAETAFAAAILGFAAATIATTGIAYTLIYRSYYAAWHAEPFSITWLFQLAFTTIGAAAQFAVLGLRLYFPVGFAALLLAGIWFARKPR